jgi:hypothetical protein
MKKNIQHQKDTLSYMQLCLYQEGKGNIYLMVPTFWNAVNNKWMGFVKTPESGRLIHAQGKDSKELKDNFNIALHKSFEENPEETFSMFKSLEYWENNL